MRSYTRASSKLNVNRRSGSPSAERYSRSGANAAPSSRSPSRTYKCQRSTSTSNGERSGNSGRAARNNSHANCAGGVNSTFATTPSRSARYRCSQRFNPACGTSTRVGISGLSRAAHSCSPRPSASFAASLEVCSRNMRGSRNDHASMPAARSQVETEAEDDVASVIANDSHSWDDAAPFPTPPHGHHASLVENVSHVAPVLRRVHRAGVVVPRIHRCTAKRESARAVAQHWLQAAGVDRQHRAHAQEAELRGAGEAWPAEAFCRESERCSEGRRTGARERQVITRTGQTQPVADEDLLRAGIAQLDPFDGHRHLHGLALHATSSSLRRDAGRGRAGAGAVVAVLITPRKRVLALRAPR